MQQSWLTHSPPASEKGWVLWRKAGLGSNSNSAEYPMFGAIEQISHFKSRGPIFLIRGMEITRVLLLHRLWWGLDNVHKGLGVEKGLWLRGERKVWGMVFSLRWKDQFSWHFRSQAWLMPDPELQTGTVTSLIQTLTGNNLGKNYVKFRLTGTPQQHLA